MVAKLKNSFSLPGGRLFTCKLSISLWCGIFINPNQLIWPKRKKDHSVSYQTFCSDNGKLYLMKYCMDDHTFLWFTAGEEEMEWTNGWGWVSLLVVFVWGFLFGWLFFFLCYFLDSSPKCQSNDASLWKLFNFSPSTSKKLICFYRYAYFCLSIVCTSPSDTGKIRSRSLLSPSFSIDLTFLKS